MLNPQVCSVSHFLIESLKNEKKSRSWKLDLERKRVEKMEIQAHQFRVKPDSLVQ